MEMEPTKFKKPVLVSSHHFLDSMLERQASFEANISTTAAVLQHKKKE